MRTPMINLQLICLLALGVISPALSARAADESTPAQEKSDTAAAPAAAANEESSRLGEDYLYTGFRWIDADLLTWDGEYEEDESSLLLGGKFEAFPLPHRYTFLGEYTGPNDYYGDFGYAFKDLVLFRDLLVGVHHNLDHYSYTYPENPPGATYEDRSFGDDNFVDFAKNDLFLRLKAPDYPLHAFVKHRYVERDGSIQERFLIGYFGGLNKKSQSRAIDWTSNDVSLGFNSHLGPVELEYAHNRFAFDPGPNSVMYDYFAAGRPPDIYPHNVIPETESSGNTIKLHTSYTGQIVSSATLSNEQSTNNYSGAESDAWKWAYDLQWMPDPTIATFFRYRHLQTDRKNPEHIVLEGAVSRASYEVRRPISTDKDLFSLSARYRPLGRLTLNGSYDYEMRERTDVEEWAVLPESSDVHRFNLSALTKLMDTLKVKAFYKYKYYEEPSYNTEPDHYNKVGVNVSASPTAWMTTLLDYSVTVTQRSDLVYLNGSSVVEGGDREGRTDLALGSVSFVLSPSSTLTASWAYSRWKIEQDMAYSMWNASGTTTTALPYYDRAAPYTDQANTLSLSLSTKLFSDLNMRTGLSYTLAEGEYLPDPAQLTALSNVETTGTVFSVELARKLMEDWEVGLKFKAGFYEDEFSDPFFERGDDELYLSLLTLKRYF